MTPQANDRAGHLTRIVARRLGDLAVRAVWIDDDEDVFVVDRERLARLVGFLRDDRDAALDILVDLTAIDRLGEDETHRFLLVVRLRSARLAYRARVECPLPTDDPTFPTLSALYRAADWLEREVHDLFGLFPDGHPFVRRLVLYPGFAGHPLRRDYKAHKGQPLVPLREPVRAADVVARPIDAKAETSNEPPRDRT